MTRDPLDIAAELERMFPENPTECGAAKSLCDEAAACIREMQATIADCPLCEIVADALRADPARTTEASR